MTTYQPTKWAEARDGYNIAVSFADGTKGVFDFESYLDYPCYSKLRNRDLFVQVKADHGTLSWPGDIDIAPERVWEQSEKNLTTI
ncbi:MAG: DUF2442 domain-containing protein [Kiritimatiellae bacterium]|nr:DUF2442 domain-containing protein [Kiritimatiellia bacterium]